MIATLAAASAFYADDQVLLFHGDWRELIGDLHADLIVTDPPYGETSLKWDRWLPGWPGQAAAHAEAMWCFGSMRMFLTHGGEFTSWRLSQDVVWEKHNGSGFHADRFKRVHEHALHWYQGRWSDRYHQPPTTADATRRTVRRRTRPTHTGQIDAARYTSDEGGPRLARSVLRAASRHGKAVNEAEKPVAVCELLIRYGCPPGGLVIDLFAGSGTTGVAAKLAVCRAVLFEQREDQCEKAARRLAQDTLTLAEGA